MFKKAEKNEKEASLHSFLFKIFYFSYLTFAQIE